MRICDVATDVPNATDTIFVDTNVWLFRTYPGATLGISQARKVLIDAYLKYMDRAANAGARLIAFTTVLIELAAVIEKEEYRFDCDQAGVDPYPKDPRSPHALKAYRENSGFRSCVASFVAQSWSETQASASIIEAHLSSTICTDAAEFASKVGMDVTDALHLEIMASNNIDIILSDDVDFSSIARDITLLTHNQRSLSNAAGNGTLTKR